MTGEESQSSSIINICPYFRVGYCKYRERCKNFHPKENCCEIKCSNKSCNKRHRKPCKFGERCTRKDSCEFLHDQKKKTKEIDPEESNTKLEMEKIMKLKDAKIEELAEKVKTLEDSIVSISEKIKAVSTLEKALVAKKDKLDSIEKKVEQALRDNEEKVESVEEKVYQNSVKICRAEKLIVHFKNKQEVAKASETNLKLSKNKPKGPSLPGLIPDRCTTLPGGASVIPV